MAFRTAASCRAGAGILGTLAVLMAAALATGQPAPVLAATPVTQVTAATAAMAAPARISCSIPQPPLVPLRRKAGTPSQFPAGRSPAACPPSSAMAPRDFRKPPNPWPAD